MRPAILVVDDDEDYLPLLVELVRESGAEAVATGSGPKALATICQERPGIDAVLTDFRLPGEVDGERIVRECRERRIPVAVVSTVDSREVAINLLRLGADDYLYKPSGAGELLERIKLFLERATLLRGLADIGATRDAVALLERAPSLRPLLADLARTAKSGATVLVRGESGTGKELVARAVHELSRRAAGPFVAVDCGAVPENLLENEFFGHRRGAFSDASTDEDGVVAQAAGGTLFLDEVGELPMAMQAKLLRFLQTREYRRLGDSKVRVADVRVVAATHRDLRAAVRSGTFREDLYYRLDVITLGLPPLRERKADIPLLATSFLYKYAAAFESPALLFSRAATDRLLSHPWPGNVRELENLVQRVVAMASSTEITAGDVERYLDGVEGPTSAGWLPSSSHAARPDAAAAAEEDVFRMPFHQAKRRVIEAFEIRYARGLLERAEGNVSRASKEAALDRTSLGRLLSRHGLSKARWSGHTSR